MKAFVQTRPRYRFRSFARKIDSRWLGRFEDDLEDGESQGQGDARQSQPDENSEQNPPGQDPSDPGEQSQSQGDPGDEDGGEGEGQETETESDSESEAKDGEETDSDETDFALAPLPDKPRLLPGLVRSNTEMILREFHSWSDFVRCAADDSLLGWKTKRHSHSASTDAKHAGFSDTGFDNAVWLALHGWPQGRELLTDSLAIVLPRPEPFRSTIFDVAGAIPIVPIYVAGDPANMMDFGSETITTKPVVKIDFDVSVAWHIKPQTVIQRGAAILSVAHSLELRGYSTELYITDHNVAVFASAPAFGIRVCFKRAGEYLDLDRAAFAMANPGTHRRFMFALLEQHSDLERAYSANYGRPTHSPCVPLDSHHIFIPGPVENETLDQSRLAVEKAASAFLDSINPDREAA